MTDYSLSHNLTLPDAFIVASAMVCGMPLFTLNVRDFDYLNQIRLTLLGWSALLNGSLVKFQNRSSKGGLVQLGRKVTDIVALIYLVSTLL